MAVAPMAKTGYIDEYTSTTSVKVDIDADGNILQPGGTAYGTKRISFKGANANNSLEDNTTVIAAFLQFCNGQQDSLSNRVQVTWEVA